MLVYKYTNKINGKTYVGITARSLDVRHREHIKRVNDGTYFHNAILKYGIDNFNLDTIDKAKTLKELKLKEKYWIKELNSFAYQDNPKGYNCTLGGDGALGLSGELNPQYKISPQERMDEDTFKQWKINLKKSAKRGNANRYYGKHPKEIFGEEAYAIACNKAKERYLNNNPSKSRDYWREKNPNAKKVVQLSKDNKYIETFNTIKEANESIKIAKSHIGSCCTGKRKTTGGYKWAYYDDYINTTNI